VSELPLECRQHTQEPPGRIGNHCWATNKPPISSPTQVGRSGKEGTSSPGARPAVMDSMLQRWVEDALSRQGSLGMVSPRPISVYAISTNIASKQETTEEMPPKRHCMRQMLRGQMLCPCLRKDKCRVLPPGKWRKKNSVELAPETPRARATKEVRCREETAGEGRERKNSARRRSPTEASPGIVGRKGPIPEKRGRIPTKDNRPANHDKPNP